MANNMSNTPAFGAFTLMTVEQADGSHALAFVEVPPGTSLNMTYQGFTGGIALSSQSLLDGSLALNTKLISY